MLYGGPWAENYWYEHYDILKDEKLGRFTPKSELLRSRAAASGLVARRASTRIRCIAAQAKKIMDAGGRVGVGSHGQLQGLGYHWEMWNIASGGATPMQVLRAATIHRRRRDRSRQGPRARSRSGKLADLVVLDANPLENIRNTNTVRLRDEERPAVRREHVRRGVAAAEDDGEAVVDARTMLRAAPSGGRTSVEP